MTCVDALALSMDANGELDWTKFDAYGFVEARIDLEYDEWDYFTMDVDWFDPEDAATDLFGDDMVIWEVDMDYETDMDTWMFMEYQTFYSWDEDKLFELTGDPLSTDLAAGGAADPNDETNFATDEFLAVWTEVELTADIFLIFEYHYDEFFEPLDCYDWTSTTSADFYGSFTFDYASWCCHNDRIYDCWADDCQTVEPGTEEAVDSWFMTTYAPLPLSEDDWLDLVIPIIWCFPYPGEEFPFMNGDVVCDPWYPEFLAWKCIEPTKCTSNEPDLDNYYNI